MRSEQKFETGLLPKKDGLWIKVIFKNGFEWVPSFEDLVRIIRAIAPLEDTAYPPPAKGRFMMLELFAKAIKDFDMTWEELAKKFQLPIRE